MAEIQTVDIGRVVFVSCHIESYGAGTVLSKILGSHPGSLGKNTRASLVENGSHWAIDLLSVEKKKKTLGSHFFFHWTVIALQGCLGFCCTMK